MPPPPVHPGARHVVWPWLTRACLAAAPTPLAAFSPTAFPTIAPTGRLPDDSNPADACPGDDDSSYMFSNTFCRQRDLDPELTYNSSFCGLGCKLTSVCTFPPPLFFECVGIVHA